MAEMNDKDELEEMLEVATIQLTGAHAEKKILLGCQPLELLDILRDAVDRRLLLLDNEVSGE